MLIALLAVLGVDLIVIVILVLVMIARRRWLTRRGAFPARVWLSEGNSDELSDKKRKGRARWISNVLVFSHGPSLFSNDIVLVDRIQGVPRPALPGEVKRLGSDPVIILFETEGGTVSLAADGEHTQEALAPFEPVAND